MTMKTGRWLAGAAGLIVLGALAIGLIHRDRSEAAQPPPSPPPTLAAADLTAMFARYGDTSGAWSGADNTASVALPDGRVAWLFSDTYLGRVDAGHTRPRDTPFVRNTIVMQQGDQAVRTVHGGTDAQPAALVTPTRTGEYYWAQDGFVAGDELYAFYNRYRTDGTGLWDFTLTGTVLATFDLPGLTLRKITELPLGDRIAWGSAVLQDDGQTYVYGAERTTDAMRFAHVARMTANGGWEFWDGSGWSAAITRSARLLSGVDTGYSVQRAGDRYVLVTTEGNLVFNPSVVAYTSPTPTGPWSGPIQLYTPPEAPPGTSLVSYDARLHPALARAGTLLLSYNVNSLDKDAGYADTRIYRPRFVEVTWPPAPPATTVPAPVGLTAAVNDVHPALRWQAVPGAHRYWMYARDVTAGQTHPARRPSPVAGTTTDPGLLKDGHTYEFQVSADDSPLSAVVRATRTRPTVPEGLTAVPRGDGRITLAWTDPGANLWYWLYQRDATNGSAWVRGDYPIDRSRGFTTVPLVHGHTYEFRIAAIGPSGESSPSAVARATARYAAPPAPTGLRVSAGDGRVGLTWTAPAGGLIYLAYYRDVTAGQTRFTRNPYPLDDPRAVVGALVDGHVYEFRVTAVRNGAEGAPSRPVRATPNPPLPAKPAHLAAKVTGPGEVTLTWTALGGNVHYWVYYRDRTAKQQKYTRSPFPAQGPPSVQYLLIRNHVYEFTVTAANQAGESPKPPTVVLRIT